MARRFLVTGGCGFIGAHLVAALLRRGDEVVAFDNLSTGSLASLPAGAIFMRGDIRDRPLLKSAMDGVDGCFHFAAIASVERCSVDWIESHDVNVGGTIAVLEAARSRTLRVVFASSAAVYGTGGEQPLEERAVCAPLSTYGADKYAGELYGGVAARLYGVPNIGVRLFNVYGSRAETASAAESVVSNFCRRIAAGCPVTIFGDGRQTRDFLHVDDAVAGLMMAMDADRIRHAVVNLCTGHALSVLDLAALISEICDRPARFDHAAARDGHVRASVGDPALARELLGFSAGISLRDGVRRILSEPASRHQPGDVVRIGPTIEALRAEP